MEPNLFSSLFAYNQWANRRVWSCISQLTDSQFDADNSYSIGSIHTHAAHTMGVEYWWFQFLRSGTLVFVSDEDCHDRISIRRKWDETETLISDYISRLTDAELARTVKPPFWSAEQPPIPVYEALFQISHHSADHRSQMLSAIHQVDGPTTPQDYLFFHFDRAGAEWSNT